MLNTNALVLSTNAMFILYTSYHAMIMVMLVSMPSPAACNAQTQFAQHGVRIHSTSEILIHHALMCVGRDSSAMAIVQQKLKRRGCRLHMNSECTTRSPLIHSTDHADSCRLDPYIPHDQLKDRQGLGCKGVQPILPLNIWARGHPEHSRSHGQCCVVGGTTVVHSSAKSHDVIDCHSKSVNACSASLQCLSLSTPEVAAAAAAAAAWLVAPYNKVLACNLAQHQIAGIPLRCKASRRWPE